MLEATAAPKARSSWLGATGIAAREAFLGAVAGATSSSSSKLSKLAFFVTSAFRAACLEQHLLLALLYSRRQAVAVFLLHMCTGSAASTATCEVAAESVEADKLKTCLLLLASCFRCAGGRRNDRWAAVMVLVCWRSWLATKPPLLLHAV